MAISLLDLSKHESFDSSFKETSSFFDEKYIHNKNKASLHKVKQVGLIYK